MALEACSEDEFIQLWSQLQSAQRVSEALGITTRRVHARRKLIEGRRGMSLVASDVRSANYYPHLTSKSSKARQHVEMVNGSAVIFSDAHFLPGVRTTAFRGLLKLISDTKPSIVVNNGDAFDGSGISRHPRIGWDSAPTVQEELRACEDRLGEIQEAAGRAKLYWPLGNHDARYETFLAANVPQYQGVKGFTLQDKFPAWEPCWLVRVNKDVVIKHRWKGGVHATHNNTVGAGVTMVTGHLHSLKVAAYDDYNGTRWGVDCGTLADPTGPQFENYLECGPTNWRSGFVVLTWKDGRLLWPELVSIWDFDHIQFRGKIIDVSKE